MLPAGAYVTLEHEYVLIVRKGGKRDFKLDAEKQNRRQSAIFWEERNLFFSDIWFDIKGSRQAMIDRDLRKRSGAFPFELAYRLINMYSVKEDWILDPFLGTGTTQAAAMACGRNSFGYEIDPNFKEIIFCTPGPLIDFFNARIGNRLESHLGFTADRIASGKPMKYQNIHYGFPVITRQETELLINGVTKIEKINAAEIAVLYSDQPQCRFNDWPKAVCPDPRPVKKQKNQQLELF
jgi:hypothetical protein